MNQQTFEQPQYLSRFNREENQGQQIDSNNKSYINQSDPFRVSQVAGRRFMTIFYAGLIAGICCAFLGIVLSVIPGTSQEDVIKNELLNINNKWIYENKQELMKNFNVQVDLLQQSNVSQQIDSASSKVNHSNPIVDSNLMELKDSLSISQQRSQASYQMGNNYKSPLVSLENAHFESKIDLNADPIFPEVDHCLQVKITDSKNNLINIQGLPNCGDFQNSLQVGLVQNKVLKFSDMIKMNLCTDDQSCEINCIQNNGEPHAIKKKSKSSHTLEKSYEIQSQTCTASFAVKEICLVFSLDQKTKAFSKFEGGCFDGNYMIYDFESKVNLTSVVLREKEDPVLASISYSSDYNPYIVNQTQKEKTALILYYTGAGIFALLILSLIFIRIKEERNSQFTKISRVTELSSQVVTTKD